MDFALILFFSYLCGSIPFGFILTKIFIGRDIRKSGSGNIGATNVLRSGNKFLAFLTLTLDVIKGYFPVIITQQYFPDLINLSCLITFLGHVFPVWLKFKGGKGVATFIGILFALSLQLAFLFMFTWLVVSLIFKYSSLSSMFSSLTVFIVEFIRQTTIPILNPEIEKKLNHEIFSTNGTSFILFIFLILIIFTHRKNIINLKNKNEDKIKL